MPEATCQNLFLFNWLDLCISVQLCDNGHLSMRRRAMVENSGNGVAGEQHPLVFFARVLAIPLIHDLLAKVDHVYQNTKKQHEWIKTILEGAEWSCRMMLSCMLQLATPVVDLIGGWDVVDDWACRRLDQLESMIPVLKQPTKVVVDTTRTKLLNVIAGENVKTPKSFAEAFHIRFKHIAEIIKVYPGGEMALDRTDEVLDQMHSILDTYSSVPEEDRKETQNEDTYTKATMLPVKARKILYESARSKLTLEGDSAPGGRVITTIDLVHLGQRRASHTYQEVKKKPSKLIELIVSLVCMVLNSIMRLCKLCISVLKQVLNVKNLAKIPRLALATLYNLLSYLRVMTELATLKEILICLVMWTFRVIVTPPRIFLIQTLRLVRAVLEMCRQRLRKVITQ